MIIEVAMQIGLPGLFMVLDAKGVKDLPFSEWHALAANASKFRESSRGPIAPAKQRLYEALMKSAKTFEDWHALFTLDPISHTWIAKYGTAVLVGEDGMGWQEEEKRKVLLEIFQKLASFSRTIRHCRVVCGIDIKSFTMNSGSETRRETGEMRDSVQNLRRGGQRTVPVPVFETIYHTHPWVAVINAIHTRTLERAVRFAQTPDDWYFIARNSSTLYELCLGKLAECATTIEDWSLYFELTSSNYSYEKNPGQDLAIRKLAELI